MKKLLAIFLTAFVIQAQAQNNICDSVGYTVPPGLTPTMIHLHGTSSIPNVILWDWSVCNAGLCFSDTGQFTHFYQLDTNDTVKVCLTAILEINNAWWSCIQCDYLVYSSNGWVDVDVLTSIKEIQINTTKNNKTYDLLGREIFEIPNGAIYIKNGKKYIRKP